MENGATHPSDCYTPKGVSISSVQLHGFGDASEEGVVYLRLVDSALVMSKTKVSPIKRLSIPRLELCGAQGLSRQEDTEHPRDVGLRLD